VAYDYDDFGVTRSIGDSNFFNEICYTGAIYDVSTGLYYLNARYYDPKNGRFITRDTYRGEINEPDALHLYAYCANNPINYVDSSGHRWIKVSITWAGRIIDAIITLITGVSTYAGIRYLRKVVKQSKRSISRSLRRELNEMLGRVAVTLTVVNTVINIALTLAGTSMGSIIANAINRYIDPRLGYSRYNNYVFIKVR